MIETGRYNQTPHDKDHVQFVIPMKSKMKFVFSDIAQNISKLEMNFSLKYRVIFITFSDLVIKLMNSEVVFLIND